MRVVPEKLLSADQYANSVNAASLETNADRRQVERRPTGRLQAYLPAARSVCSTASTISGVNLAHVRRTASGEFYGDRSHGGASVCMSNMAAAVIVVF